MVMTSRGSKKKNANAGGRDDANHEAEPVGKQAEPTRSGHASPLDKKDEREADPSAPYHLALCFECTISALSWRSRRRSPWIM